MKTTEEVLGSTGISYLMLTRLKELGVIPKPTLQGRGAGGGRGVVGHFDDDVIDTINRVKLQQKLGLSLVQIAEKLREERASLQDVEPHKKVVIPVNPDPLKSYIKARPGFHKQLESENPGYEVERVELDNIEYEGNKYLTPVRIIMRPKK